MMTTAAPIAEALPASQVATTVTQKKKKKKKKKTKMKKNKNLFQMNTKRKQVQWGGAQVMNGMPPPTPTWQLRAKQFAPKYRKEADQLLYLLQKSGRLKYNSKWEIILDGKLIPQSNILRLIEHCLSSKNKTKLIGLKRFYFFLMDLGIPNTLVKNEWAKKLVSKRKGPGSGL